MLKEETVEEVDSAQCWSLLTDETKDCSKSLLLTIALRYIAQTKNSYGKKIFVIKEKPCSLPY
jgi:hypothetical protein